MAKFAAMSLRMLILFFLIVIAHSLHAQRGGARQTGTGIIHGHVRSGEEALPYASVSLYRSKDSSLVTGIISDEKGKFELKEISNGMFYMKVTFVGFQTLTIPSIEITPINSIVKMEDLELMPTTEALKEVEVTSDLPAMEYHIDKKVINVDKQLTATSGSAVDVLQNVPSVQVSITGDVSLRGSSGFMVFIDGRPSALSGSEALNQIPASSIDKIELITNPSAKYDPDGTAGIINIITKKNMLEGFSGVVNANAGSFGAYGGDLLIYYRKKKINYFAGANYSERNFPGLQRISRITETNDTLFFTKADGTSDRQSTRYSLKGGIEAQLSVHDYLAINATGGFRDYNGLSELDYLESTNPATSTSTYLSRNTSSRSGGFYSISGDYDHKFKNEDHKISGQIVYNWRNSIERNDNELVMPGELLRSGQRSTEDGPGSEFRSKLDYVLPLADKKRLEMGSQLRMSLSSDTNKVYNYNPANDNYEFQAKYSNSIKYQNDIFALYGIFRNEKNKLGYQVGLRTEHTSRYITKIDGDSSTSLYRWDFFPSIHLSYDLPKNNQIMINYSRRIDRPRGWYFEPFITWVDAYNVRRGNPALLPEYIDSYELGYSKKIEKTLFSLETYYRQVHNKIESYRSVYSENVMLTTYQNVGIDHSLGMEGMISTDLTTWWNMDLMGNLYYFRGEYTISGLNNKSTNWNSRFNNTFYIKKETQLQVNSMYNSASISAQGRVEDYYTINAALKRTFYQKKLTLTLQVSDIFRSSRRQSTSEGVDFMTEEYRRNLSPIVMFNVSYRINNFKINKGDRNGDSDGGEEF